MEIPAAAESRPTPQRTASSPPPPPPYAVSPRWQDDFTEATGACRDMKGGSGTFTTTRGTTFDACRRFCLEDACYAFEYNSYDDKARGGAACEVHVAPIARGDGETRPGDVLHCYIRNKPPLTQQSALTATSDLSKLDPRRVADPNREEELAVLKTSVAELARELEVAAGGRFIFTIATREALPYAFNMVWGARRHGAAVAVFTLFQRECDELKQWGGIACRRSGVVPVYKGDVRAFVGDGYKLTFAKFDVIRLAIEMGYQPTFIDSDVAVTSSVHAALDKLRSHDFYVAVGRNNRCDTCIDGFMHCGRGCRVGGAAWRIMSRFAQRRASFEANWSTFWADTDARNETSGPHHKVMTYRENVLLNDVLQSECCGHPSYVFVQPATATILNRAAVNKKLGAPSAVGRKYYGCNELGKDRAGALFRLLPEGGTLAIAPTDIVGSFQGGAQELPVVVTGKFGRQEPPALAHFVGATPYKLDMMAAFGMWDHRVERVAMGLGLLRRGNMKLAAKGCNVEKYNCPNQLSFNGLDLKQNFFTRAFVRPEPAGEKTGDGGLKFLAVELAAWPTAFDGLARVWVAGERLARLLGREVVFRGVPCAFGWAREPENPKPRVLGDALKGSLYDVLGETARAALVKGTCRAPAGEESAEAATGVECCTLFFDLVGPPFNAGAKCGGIAEQLYACTDHIHPRRFEAAVTSAEEAAAVKLDADMMSQQASAARVVRYRAASADDIAAELRRAEAAARAGGVNASAAWRQYHLTESRLCEPGSAARLCAGAIADA